MTHTQLRTSWADGPLWADGSLDLVEALPTAVHLTGTRHASTYGATVSRSFATALSNAGHHIATGLNFGCEASVVRAVLACRRPVIVVLPCGLDHVYPAAHADLLARVLQEGGLVLSPFSPEVTISRWTVQQRHAWISTHSCGTLVLGAAARSEALYCADTAAAHHRPVASVPGPIDVASTSGSNGLLADGATAIVDYTTLLSWAESAAQPAARLALVGSNR